MKNLFWEIEAAVFREILRDSTTAEELRSNFMNKAQQAAKILEDKNPSLFQELKAAGPSQFMSSINEFMDEIMTLVPKTDRQMNLFDTVPAVGGNEGPFGRMSDFILADQGVEVKTSEGMNFKGLAWPEFDALSSDSNVKSAECRCPDLLAGHHNGCVYGGNKVAPITTKEQAGKVQNWRQDLTNKLGIYKPFAESAVLFAPTIDQAFAADKAGLPHISELEIGDLIYVEEKETPRNVEGSFLGVVIDPEPSEDEDGNPGDYYDVDVSIIDSFGNAVSPERFWLGKEDKIIVLKRDGQEGPIRPTL